MGMIQRGEPDGTGKLPLSPEQRRTLRQLMRTTSEVRLYRRLMALILVDRGQAVTDVAKLLGVSRASVHNWLQSYLRSLDPAALSDRPGRGRRSSWNASLQDLLEQALAVPPLVMGYRATGWTLPLLAEHLERLTLQRLSVSTLRRQMHARGLRFKRPRYSLVPDPEYRKKTRDSSPARLPSRRDFAVGPR